MFSSEAASQDCFSAQRRASVGFSRPWKLKDNSKSNRDGFIPHVTTLISELLNWEHNFDDAFVAGFLGPHLHNDKTSLLHQLMPLLL